jgi:RNA polymerase sigma factor (sigma-70 family)
MGLESNWQDLEGLLARCRRQDGTAWGQLVDRFQNLVYSIPRRYGLGDEDAADVFQHTFQSLLRNIDRIESAQTLPKWLSVTASRESLRIRRISGRSVLAEDRSINLDQIVASEESDAESNAVVAEQAEILRLKVGELKERCRELLTALYLADDEPYADISARLGIPIGAIGPTRARCLEKLRRLLVDTGLFS